MSPSEPRPPRSSLFLWLAFLVILATGGGLAWLLARAGVRSPVRIVMLAPLPEDQSGLQPGESRAICSLIQDHLEHLGGFAVTNLDELPADLTPFQTWPRTLIFQAQPVRKGDDLVLSYRSVWGTQVTKGSALPWTRHPAEVLVPRQAFASFMKAFPAPIQIHPKASFESLVPKSASLFWRLINANALRFLNQRLPEALAQAETVTREEPDCASGWILLGNLRYRELLNNPSALRQQQTDTEIILDRGLALAPGHPRGVFLLSLLQSDNGNQREALDLLLRTRRRQPHNPTLLTGIAYAARGAGLLPLARRAMDIRDELAFARFQPQAVDITCLYTGETEKFEASLQEQPGHLRSSTGVLPFYRGYLALVRGDHPLAQKEFRLAVSLSSGYPTILKLSEIYVLILDGRKDQAWTKLREYDQERIGMREPDGEFTIRLAEAYALVGDRASAMEMANRAFSRGFGCTEWYERSPMLEPLRSLPKWKALMQHVKERQSLMADRFPIGLLEDN